jgi:hypothetical protein
MISVPVHVTASLDILSDALSKTVLYPACEIGGSEDGVL